MQLTTSRLITILAAAGAVVMLIVCVPLMVSTMRAPGADCGTVFSSSDSWTYSSSFDSSDTSSYYEGARSQADIRAGAEAAIGDWYADMSRGAAAYEYCEDRHSDRRILLISLGSVAVALAAAAGAVWWVGRSRASA
ncbi:hypothetical protein [Gordonia metallireducens]|uniref:hypothetical protein n=1 Tax=Gordonia metallireducens TaxID=2897779 RepID=UPI001E2D7ABE|nr:hypothetical protein [Gordonia metallireducens]